MTALRVVARLANGFTAGDPWSPSLDGILAYWHLRERLGDEAFALGSSGHVPLVAADDLPLERVADAAGAHWWYACSQPVYTTAAQFARFTHRRFDSGLAERYTTEQTRRVLTSGGPYKAYRHRHTVTVPAGGVLTWHALGDAAAVERLLRRCTSVGRGLGRGEGVVLAWRVTADGDARLARLYRPLPADYAAAHGVTGTVQRWGIRPPGRLPEHQALCVLPTRLEDVP